MTTWKSSSLTKTTHSPNSKNKITGTDSPDSFTELSAPLVWHFALSTLIYICVSLLRSSCPLEIFKNKGFFPVWACLKWLWLFSQLRQQETWQTMQEMKQRRFMPKDWPEDGGREQSSLPPSSLFVFLGHFNPRRPQGPLDTSLHCYTAASWLVPSTYFLCFKLKALVYIEFIPLDLGTRLNVLQAGCMPLSRTCWRTKSVLVVIKIKHFLEPLLPKMLMQFTFFQMWSIAGGKVPINY